MCFCYNWPQCRVAESLAFAHCPCLPARPQTPATGWLEAFAAHPKIGDLRSLHAKYGAFAELSKGEQYAAAGASEQTLQVGRAWRAAAESGGAEA